MALGFAASCYGQVTETVVYSFSGGTNSGSTPQGITVGPDGALCGTTLGAVFRVLPTGLGFTVLHVFGTSGTDGDWVQAPPVWGADGALYGVTYGGGTNDGGTVYRVNPDGSGYQRLLAFGATKTDAYWPETPLLSGAGGVLYGFGSGQPGALFRLNPDGTGLVVLQEFPDGDNTTGFSPNGPLVQGPGGTLYGTTRLGAGCGTVFSIKPDGTGFQRLVSFGDIGAPCGGAPEAGLAWGLDGALYGTTTFPGIIFKTKPDGSGAAGLYGFSYHLDGTYDPHDGSTPQAPLFLASDGAFYGTTQAGGDFGLGTVFRFDPATTNYTRLYSFTGQAGDGESPNGAPLVQGPDGALYGTTPKGGACGDGAVFRLATPGLISSYAPRFKSATMSPNGSLTLCLAGLVGSAYQIQASTDLASWTSLTGSLTNTSGTITWVDNDAMNHPQRFYRAVKLP